MFVHTGSLEAFPTVRMHTATVGNARPRPIAAALFLAQPLIRPVFPARLTPSAHAVVRGFRHTERASSYTESDTWLLIRVRASVRTIDAAGVAAARAEDLLAGGAAVRVAGQVIEVTHQRADAAGGSERTLFSSWRVAARRDFSCRASTENMCAEAPTVLEGQIHSFDTQQRGSIATHFVLG